MIQNPPEAGQVLHAWLERARADGRQAGSDEVKRDETRVNWVVSVDVAIDVPGGERRIRSRTRDVSDKGLGIHCREAIPIGKTVRVYLRDGVTNEEHVEGQVNHCTMTVGGYKVGVCVVP